MFFERLILIFNFVYVYLCVGMCILDIVCGQKRGSSLLELQLKADVNCHAITGNQTEALY